jgi:hypothetical protein
MPTDALLIVNAWQLIILLTLIIMIKIMENQQKLVSATVDAVLAKSENNRASDYLSKLDLIY